MSFLPKDEQFHELLRKISHCGVEAAHQLHLGLGSSAQDGEETRHRIAAIETQADDAAHECLTRLYQTFITPFDPEDIHDLCARLDDIVDAFYRSARVLDIVGGASPPPEAAQLSALLVSEAEACRKAVETLTHGGDVAPEIARMSQLANQADEIHDAALKRLYSTEPDAVAILKGRELLEAFSETAHRFKDAGHVIERVSLKNT